MSRPIHESIVHIFNPEEPSKFGSGFVVQATTDASYIVTCTHVLKDVGGTEKARIYGWPDLSMDVVLCNDVDAEDLTVLRAKGLTGKPPLVLSISGEPDTRIKVYGSPRYIPSGDRIRLLRPLDGILTGQDYIFYEQRHISVWQFKITDDKNLVGGYSGGPVIDEATGKVIAITRISEGEKQGLAVSVAALCSLWQDCPLTLSPDPNLGSVLDTSRPPPEPSLEGLLNDLLVRIADDDNKYKDLLRGAFHQIATPEWFFSGSLDRVELFNQVIESVRTQPHPHLRGYSDDERVIIFTEILMYELPEPTVQVGRAWIDRFAESKGIPPERVCELRDNLKDGKLKPVDPAPMESYPSLLIKIKNHPRLLLDAYLWKSRQDIYPLVTDKVFEPQEISDILPELLDKSLCYISGETHILCIEFFVPHEFYLERKLFPRRLDNLEIEWGLDEQHLGTYYRVVVRSLERIEGKHVERLRDRWLEKWKSFLGNIDEYIKAQHNPVATPKSIAGNYQNLDAHLLDRNVLGLALSHGSFSGCGIKPQKLFKKMLVTGIPIALWIEPDENHYLPTPDQQIMAELDDLEQALEAIATVKNLPGLVSLVKDKRREARTQNRQLHIGSFLTLFWDDPYRIPEFPEADSQVSASET